MRTIALTKTKYSWLRDACFPDKAKDLLCDELVYAHRGCALLVQAERPHYNQVVYAENRPSRKYIPIVRRIRRPIGAGLRRR